MAYTIGAAAPSGERVSTQWGPDPCIIVAPHGPDDSETAEIAELAAGDNFSYVINRGWSRAANVDILKSLANCNNIEHCKQDPVKDEFLDPLMRFVVRYHRQGLMPRIFIIHGVGDQILKKHPDLSVIVGYGAGPKPRSSASADYTAVFVEELCNHINALIAGPSKVYCGAAGGKYAGYDKQNLNQYFVPVRGNFSGPRVSSLQIEIVSKFRKNQLAIATALRVAIHGANHRKTKANLSLSSFPHC